MGSLASSRLEVVPVRGATGLGQKLQQSRKVGRHETRVGEVIVIMARIASWDRLQAQPRSEISRAWESAMADQRIRATHTILCRELPGLRLL